LRTAELVEHESHFALKIPKPSTRYVDQFLRLVCSGDLLNLGAMDDTRRITVAMGLFEQVRRHLAPKVGLDNEAVQLVVAGTTSEVLDVATLFAFRTKWTVTAIVRIPGEGYDETCPVAGVERLTLSPFDLTEGYWMMVGPTIIVLPDATVAPDLATQRIMAYDPHADAPCPRAMVVLGTPPGSWPIPYGETAELPPALQHLDPGIWVADPTISIWR